MEFPRFGSYAEWYQKGPLASYVRTSGTAGEAITIIEASQPAGDMSDPAVNELVMIRAIGSDVQIDVDLGAGRFRGSQRFGDFLLVAPNTASDLQVHTPHTVEIYSLPAANCLALLGGERPQGLDFGRLHEGLFRSDLLTALCQRLADSIRRPHAASRLLVDGAAMALLAELTLLAGSAGSAIEERRLDVRDWRIRRSIEKLEAQLAEDVSLDELAASVDLSPSRFTLLFRTATGLPPHAWLVRRKIERACELLLNPGLPVTEIARALGFSSSQHFATTFRSQKGITPSAWRSERLS